MQPALGVAVRSLLNQMFGEIRHFYHFHVNINKLRKRTLNFGLIANPFYFVVLELLGGIRKAAAVAFLSNGAGLHWSWLQPAVRGRSGSRPDLGTSLGRRRLTTL